MPHKSKKLISFLISFCLILEQSVFAQSIDLSHYFTQNPGKVIPQSDNFRPLHLRYISYDNLSQDFKLLLDKGDTRKEDLENKAYIEQNTRTLLKYFFIGLALPNDKFWVNLRPDSPDNILDPDLEKTDIGRIFLEADLQLKKDTASFTSPQTPEGKAYWDKLYRKAGELFGTENITIPTITRPWIVPNEIIIREAPDNAYIYKATLKVMLEEDYLKSSQPPEPHYQPLSSNYNFSDPRFKELNQYSTQLIKETIIPKLTREVNASKRYAPLRQVYYSLILAQWFKQKYQGRFSDGSSLLERTVPKIDSNDLTNLTSKEPYDKQSYFKQYQKSFAEGEYSLQEPVYTPMGQSVRRYMSGGLKLNKLNVLFGRKIVTADSSIASIPTHSAVASSLEANNLGIKVGHEGSIEWRREALPQVSSSPTGKKEGTASSAVDKEKYIESYNKYYSNIVSYNSIKKLAQDLKNKNPGEEIVTEPFKNIEEIEDLLEIIGTEFEIGFSALIAPEGWTGPLNAHINITLEKKRDLVVTVYKIGKRVRLLKAQIETIFRRWGLIDTKGTVIVLTRGKGGSVSMSQSAELYFHGHSHPEGFPGVSRYSDEGGDMLSFATSPSNRSGAINALKPEEWREPFNNKNIPEGDRVYMLDYDGKVKIISKKEAAERTMTGEIMVYKNSKQELIAIHLDISGFEILNREGNWAAYYSNEWMHKILRIENSDIHIEVMRAESDEYKIIFRRSAGEKDLSVVDKDREVRSTAEGGNVYDIMGSVFERLRGKDQGFVLKGRDSYSMTRIFDKSGKQIIVGSGEKEGKVIIFVHSDEYLEAIKTVCLYQGFNFEVKTMLPPFTSEVIITPEGEQTSSSLARQSPGGIDFTQLPIVTQAITNLSSSLGSSFYLSLRQLNLSEEYQAMKSVVSLGISPSPERLKSYLQASCLQDKIREEKDKALGLLAEVLRQEESSLCPTVAGLRDILVVLESSTSNQQLKEVLLGK